MMFAAFDVDFPWDAVMAGLTGHPWPQRETCDDKENYLFHIQ